MSANRQSELHLSSEQLSAWILGDRDALLADHVASCPACRNKIEQFENGLRNFRSSVRTWSENKFVARPSRAPSRWRPLAAITAFCLVAIFLVAFLSHRETRIAAQPSSHNDAALLSEIDQEVSRTVPAAMDPLSALVAGDGARASEKVVR